MLFRSRKNLQRLSEIIDASNTVLLDHSEEPDCENLEHLSREETTYRLLLHCIRAHDQPLLWMLIDLFKLLIVFSEGGVFLDWDVFAPSKKGQPHEPFKHIASLFWDARPASQVGHIGTVVSL